MDAIECIETRASIRKFRPEPVPRKILLDIIKTARRSPSYKNSQPWEVIIISGTRKAALSKILIERLGKGEKPAPDIPEPKSWPAEIENRIRDNLAKRSETFGIDLTDPDIVKKSKIANFRFYDAPHGIFLFQDSSLNEWSILDMGMFAQNIMLAAHACGLGTVPQAFLTDYSAEIKSFLEIPGTKRLVLGISIGYPEKENVFNRFRTEREDVNRIVRWVE